MWIVFIARKALLSFYYFIVMRLFSGSLNSKIPDVYYEEVSLHYYDGAYMTATVNVGKQFAGRPVQVTSIYKSGYPTQQTWNVSATPVDSNGSTTIWAYGSNYVSAHVMNVLVRCETDPT